MLRLRLKNVLLFLTIACAGVGLAIAFYVFLYNSETSKITQRQERIDGDIESASNTFHDVVDQIETAVRNALSAALVSSTSMASLFSVFPNTTYPQFTRFVYQSNVLTPSVRAIYYIQRMNRTDAPAAQQRMRVSGYPNFTIRNSVTDEYYVCLYMEPYADNPGILGQNFMLQTSRLVAINSSRDTAQPAATSRNTVTFNNVPEYAFLIYVPLYDAAIGSGGNATVQQRNYYFRGVVGTSFRISPLIKSALGNRTSTNVYIFDLDASTPNTSLLYTNTNFSGDFPMASLPSATNRVLVPLTAADRRWALIVDTTDFSSTAQPYKRTAAPAIVLGAVLLATILSLVYLVDAIRRQERIQRLTDEQAAAVQAADILADHIAEMKLDGIAIDEGSSALQQKLYRIVCNLRRYRPYLPDILFANDHESGEDTADNKGKQERRRHSSGIELQSTGSLHSSHSGNGGIYRVQERQSHDGSRSSASKATVTRGDRMAQRLNGGLANRQVSLLLVRIHGLNYLADTDGTTTDLVTSEILTACAQCIRTHQGSLTSCGSGYVLATWNAASTMANHQVRACRCALELEAALQSVISKQPKLTLQIAVDTGMLLVGNVCTSNVSAFHTLGSRMIALDAMARLNQMNNTTILLSTAAYRSVQSLFVLRPVDIVDFSALTEKDFEKPAAEIVYELPSQPLQTAGHDEWMYNLSRVERSIDLERAFVLLLTGQNSDAAPLLRQFAIAQPAATGRVAHLIEFCAAPKQEARYRRAARAIWSL
eukprot:TRINITY_DN4168_c0_g1_i1.p1 TRINITY_DN4168_c0_g1~~TRINITY_DN4168_c0_g1_i1.p1  ORF type:complete len:767 (+),score=123.02 TRINITY_DN4168_c0_g1_i1:51-2351(+)